MKSRPAAPPRGKRAYATPKLVVHGDLKALTMAKKGTNGDGGAKPRTKTSGANG